MPTHNPNDPNNPQRRGDPDSSDWANAAPSDDLMSLHQQPDAESLKVGYELTDANITDIAGFLVVMAASIAVVFVLAFGIGKLIYYGLNKQDGAGE